VVFGGLHLSPLIAANPKQTSLYARRGKALAELGRWQQAESDFREIIAQNPKNDDAWFNCALLRLHAGDIAAYHTVCQKALEVFPPIPNVLVTNELAWMCVLGPDCGVAPAKFVALAERNIKREPTANHFNTLGAALCRAGNYEQAIQNLDRSIDLQEGKGVVDDWLFLALAHHHVGHRDLAQKWLAKAVQFLNALASDAGGRLPLWNERLSWQLFRREVEAQMKY